MNKFLRYSLSLVLAFVASVTFAGNNSLQSVSLFPDEGTESKAISAYDKTSEATIGEDFWTIANFNSNKWNWHLSNAEERKKHLKLLLTSHAIR